MKREPKLSKWWKTPSAKAAFKLEETRKNNKLKKLNEWKKNHPRTTKPKTTKEGKTQHGRRKTKYHDRRRGEERRSGRN